MRCSLRAVCGPKGQGPHDIALTVAGQPIRAAAPNAQTVVFTYPAPSGPGVGLLNNLTILPKHKLEAALNAGTLATTWDSKTPLTEIVGSGAFVIREYQPGQRLVLDRNPRYWRKAADGQPLPYLDRVVLEMVPEQNAELLRLQAGSTDLTYTELRSEDYVAARRGETEGTLKVIELGVAPDADAFWFCLKPDAKKADKRFAFVQKPEFRQALSYAIDREAFAETVFLGAAVPIWGPITPGNKVWFWPDIPRYPHNVARAREMLKSLGLDAVINYKKEPIRDALEKATPKGIDVYFDNVGGDHLDAAFALAKQNARFAICGMIEGYNKAEPSKFRFIMRIIAMRIAMKGFIVFD